MYISSVPVEKSNTDMHLVKYDDRFIDYHTFNWMSKNKRTLQSPDVREILNPQCRLYLFIQKGDDDSTDFYYMGRVKPIPGSENETLIINDDGKQLPIVNIKFELDPPVNVKLYDYLTS